MRLVVNKNYTFRDEESKKLTQNWIKFLEHNMSDSSKKNCIYKDFKKNMAQYPETSGLSNDKLNALINYTVNLSNPSAISVGEMKCVEEYGDYYRETLSYFSGHVEVVFDFQKFKDEHETTYD